MKYKILILLFIPTICQTLYASEASEEIALLRQEVRLLTERLNKLENKSEGSTNIRTDITKISMKQPPSKKKSINENWSDRVTFKADFRDRYEYIDQKERSIRQRNRVRLRAQFDMKVNDNLSFTLGMATGADDPVSTNQSLDDAFSTKDLRLNLAYYSWRMNDKLTLIGGKMNNPFYRPTKNPILWDGDLNPEGFAFIFDNDVIQASLVGFDVEERKADDDTLLFGGQMMHAFKVSNSSKVLAGIGYYDYRNIKGNEPLFDGKPKGNTLDSNGNFATDFNTAEIFLDYKSKLAGRPLSIYANFYQNTAINDLNTAYTAGFMYGKVKNSGSWKFGLAYLDVEADAVFGLFNDSDFAGGNTDSKGLLLKAGYGLQKNMSLGLTYIDSVIGQSKLLQTDYDRLQLDFKIKFK